jgi:hypothetical protein
MHLYQTEAKYVLVFVELHIFNASMALCKIFGELYYAL